MMASKNNRSKIVSNHAVITPVASTTALAAAKPAAAPLATPAAAVAPPKTVAPAASVAVAAPAATAPASAAAPKPAAVFSKPADSARDRSTIVALIAKLRDPEADVARDAAATLGGLPADSHAVDALCAVVGNADHYFHPVVRTAAAGALGQLRDPRAVDALVLATQDTMAEASEEAIKSLGILGDVKAIPTLQAIIRNEKSFYLETVRKAATQSLARLNP